MKLNRFALFTWGVLACNILVILWGAVVRATGSGAGCGKNWPLCNDEIIPQHTALETVIEFTHRLTSGLALILVIIMLVWAFRAYSKGHPVRLGASISMFFIITEALVGAGLVLFGWVAQDTSPTRAIVVAIHLTNTFALLASLTLTAWWASGGRPLQFKGQGWVNWAIGISFLALFMLGITGAMTALSDTLFPASSLAEGLQQKYSPSAHFLVRLRVFHPLIAIIVGIYLIAVAGIFNAQRATPATRRIARTFIVIYLTQLAVGAFNVVLLTPIWIQLVHLLLTDLLLIAWVLFAAAALAKQDSHTQNIANSSVPSTQEAYGSSSS